MKHTVKETVLRILILFVGLTIAHLGVTLFLLANLGADPFNVLIQGLYRIARSFSDALWLTHGRIHMAVCFLIILTLLVVDRSYVKVGTVICMFCGGPIIDFFTGLLAPLFSADPGLWVRVVVNCLGCVILAYGMTIVIKSDAGTGPNDLVAVVLSDKLKKKFSVVRILVDCCFAGLGFAMGGTLGLGTVICAFLVGSIAGLFLPVNQKLIDGLVKKVC